MQSNAAFKGQNNYHSNMPALMSDDREQRSWYPEAVVDNNIKKSANITSNWEYRKYLMSNADNLMDINMRNAIMQNPTEDIINISSNKAQLNQVEIYNVSGKLLSAIDLNTKTYALSILNYPSGMYVLRVLSENNEPITVKIIKK